MFSIATVCAGIEAGLLTFAAGAEVTNQVSLGVMILGAVVTLATIIGVFYGVRHKVVAQVAAERADQLHAYLDEVRAREKRVEERLAEAQDLIVEQKETITRLESLPNLERVIQLMADTADRTDKRAQDRQRALELVIGEHEDRALERHRELIAALERVADILNRKAA